MQSPVISVDDRMPATVSFSAPQVWWLSPIVVSLLVAVASIVPTALIGDEQFRSLWRTPKAVTGGTLLLFGCGAMALAFGALVALAAAPIARPASSPWPRLSDRSVALLRRLSTALTAATVIGYAGFVILIMRSGLNPLELFSFSLSESSAMSVREIVGTIPGITTLTQLGIAAVVTSTVLLVREYSRSELSKLLIVLGLALPRAYLFSERLAVLELVVPMTVILAAHFSVQRGLRRRLMQVMPFVSFVAVVVLFGFFEYFRSWTFYRTQTTTSYSEFALDRFAGYYTTALNNGHLILEHLQWPNRLPYDTIEAFWTAPGIQSTALYEKLGGHPPPYTREVYDSAYYGVVSHFANVEFNNQSGYVGGFVDYGALGGVLFFVVAGVIAGLLYRAFSQSKPFGLFLYPVVFVGLLELPRYLYWSQGRTTYAWIALVVIAVMVSRSEAKERMGFESAARKNARAVISRITTPLWAATVAAVVVGVAAGGFLHGNNTCEATALIRLYQPIDPNQIMTGTPPSAELQQSYMSGEIAYLNSSGFADAVSKQLNETRTPQLTATQSAQSTIVTVSATEPDFAEARRMVDAALQVYGDHLRQQTRERGQAAIEAIDDVIRPLQASAGQAGNPQATAPTDNPGDDTPARIQQLQLQRLAIEVQTGRAAPMQIVQPPTKTPITGLPSWALGAVGGGLIAGLLTLAGVLAWRKRVGVITAPSALQNKVGHVLVPTVRLGAYDASSAAYVGLARSLFAQLPAPRSGRILLVGASADSGTEDVAELIAFAAAEQTDVCFEPLVDGDEPFDCFEAPGYMGAGVTTVISGGSIDRSPALPKVADDASQIVIVAMISRDTSAAVHVASQLGRDSEVPISLVCTRGPILRARPNRRTKNRAKHAWGFVTSREATAVPATHESPALRSAL